ncbi:hypothetical protein K490DRAFT_62073 [Saccharata proteae CBS 121410]|uniref:GPR1/FUN34/yaaH family-domain-containing protein n=1 Tax=Saccharata proteae CBS 121410 TaxID=1314787 RepID=A0A9P4I1C9_9PEZI|nr:hypothetical protein K490DRAFT_62073 [Saccharata proteae CBS 121410]
MSFETAGTSPKMAPNGPYPLHSHGDSTSTAQGTPTPTHFGSKSNMKKPSYRSLQKSDSQNLSTELYPHLRQQPSRDGLTLGMAIPGPSHRVQPSQEPIRSKASPPSRPQTPCPTKTPTTPAPSYTAPSVPGYDVPALLLTQSHPRSRPTHKPSVEFSEAAQEYQPYYSSSGSGASSPYRPKSPGGPVVKTREIANFDQEPQLPPQHHNQADAKPLGFAALALTLFLFSLQHLSSLGPNASTTTAAIGPVLAVGGLVQVLAAMWAMALGSTLGATVFGSYGCFWLAYGIAMDRGSGAVGSGGIAELDMAFALCFYAWFAWSVLLTSLSMRRALAPALFFLSMDFVFLFAGLGAQYGTVSVGRRLNIATGVFGMGAATTAGFLVYHALADERNSFARVSLGNLPWSEQGTQMGHMRRLALIEKCKREWAGFSAEQRRKAWEKV